MRPAYRLGKINFVIREYLDSGKFLIKPVGTAGMAVYCIIQFQDVNFE